MDVIHIDQATVLGRRYNITKLISCNVNVSASFFEGVRCFQHRRYDEQGILQALMDQGDADLATR